MTDAFYRIGIRFCYHESDEGYKYVFMLPDNPEESAAIESAPDHEAAKREVKHPHRYFEFDENGDIASY